MKPDQILESLSLLDPADDEHWTQEGLPRLDMVGEGVSRKEIQAVAPLFNRRNAEVPEPPEPEPTREELEAAMRVRKLEAEVALKSAVKVRNEAIKAVADAEKVIAGLAMEAREIDKRSDTEINQEFLNADFQNRLKKAEQREQASRLLAQAGVNGNDIRMYTLGPADRAIAEANIHKRKQALKNS